MGVSSISLVRTPQQCGLWRVVPGHCAGEKAAVQAAEAEPALMGAVQAAEAEPAPMGAVQAEEAGPAPTVDLGAVQAEEAEPAPTVDMGTVQAEEAEPAPTVDMGTVQAEEAEPAPTVDLGAVQAEEAEPATTVAVSWYQYPEALFWCQRKSWRVTPLYDRQHSLEPQCRPGSSQCLFKEFQFQTLHLYPFDPTTCQVRSLHFMVSPVRSRPGPSRAVLYAVVHAGLPLDL
eukprot:s1992_g8.t1